MPYDMFNEPCLVIIIIFIPKWMTDFPFYLSSDYEHYQLMNLHIFEVT